jgi:hypothetical protein
LNIVDRLTGGKAKGPSLEEKIRHDLLLSSIRAKNPNFGPENVDLSEVNLALTDDETRAAIAKELGITAQERIDAIDLDEIISPSGEHRRRAKRHYRRAQEAQRRKGQRAFRRQQRKARFAQGRPSNHDVILLRRERDALLAAAREQAAAEVAG